jgi:single-strand DNA-binding protein
MAHVQVIQRHAHLAGAPQLAYIERPDGHLAKARLTAISNHRRGSGEAREEEATAIQWTLWGALAENAVAYLDKGSHVNIVGRLRNNRYEKDGQTVYGMDFTAESIDFLDSRERAEARRGGGPKKPSTAATAAQNKPKGEAPRARSARRSEAAAPAEA